MSCEVLCCDISDILDTLVEASDGQLLEKLFSLLSVDPPLDCRLAGYFEKVCAIELRFELSNTYARSCFKVVGLLLRRKTLNVITYINKQGMPLFALFARHLGSYSMMELVKRMFQPGFGGEFRNWAPSLLFISPDLFFGVLIGSAEMFADGLMGFEQEEQTFPTIAWHNEAAVIDTLLDIFEPGVESDIQNNAAEVHFSTVQH
jgi:hypothetical protein